MYVLQYFSFLPVSDPANQMMISNSTDRFTVAIAAIKGGAQVNPRVAVDSHENCSLLKHMQRKEKEYIFSHGKGRHFSICIKLYKCTHNFDIQDRDGLFDVPKFN